MITNKSIEELSTVTFHKILSNYFFDLTSLIRKEMLNGFKYVNHMQNMSVRLNHLDEEKFTILCSVVYVHKNTGHLHTFPHEITVLFENMEGACADIEALVDLISFELGLMISMYQEAECDVACDKCELRHGNCSRGRILENAPDIDRFR